MTPDNERQPASERNEDHEIWTAQEVANYLRVSTGWVRDHATRKMPRLKAIKLGKILRFFRRDVEAFAEQWCQ